MLSTKTKLNGINTVHIEICLPLFRSKGVRTTLLSFSLVPEVQANFYITVLSMNS